MNKNSNPFITLIEAQARLATLGADPTSRNLYAGSVDWREHILNIMVKRVYEQGTHYYKIEIHLDTEGFDSVCSLINGADELPPLLKKKHSDKYDMHYIEPSSLLRLFTLVDVPCAQISEEEATRGT